MSRRGRSLTVAGVLLAAFLGGAASHLLFDASTARAADQGYVVPEAVQGQVIHAFGFVVVDASGKELARLGPSDKGAVALTVLDAKGKERLRVGALEEPAGYGMDARDADGHSRATFAYGADDVGGVRLYDAEGLKRLGMGFGPQGAGLNMQNAAGVTIVGVGVAPGAGGGDFVLKRPPDGQEVWAASKAAEGAYSAAQAAPAAQAAQALK